MNWFETYCSNTLGAGGNQTIFSTQGQEMKRDFAAIVRKLKGEGIRVFLISVPPYDWQDDALKRWNAINEYLVTELSGEADGFFHVAPLLTDPARGEGKCKYGTHPNEEGCRVWAEAMLPLFSRFLDGL